MDWRNSSLFVIIYTGEVGNWTGTGHKVEPEKSHVGISGLAHAGFYLDAWQACSRLGKGSEY